MRRINGILILLFSSLIFKLAIAGEVQTDSPESEAEVSESPAPQDANKNPEATQQPSAENEPKIGLQLISPAGKVIGSPKWPIKSEWIWESEVTPEGTGAEVKPDQTYSRPVFRVWIQVPNNLELGNNTNSEVHAEMNPKDHPFGKKTKVISVDAEQFFVPLPLRLVREVNGQKKTHSLSLMMTLSYKKPPFLVDPLCEELGVHQTEARSGGHQFYSALSCREKDGIMSVHLLSSQDGRFDRVVGFGKKIVDEPGHMHYQFRRPKDGAITKRRVGVLSVSSKDLPGRSDYVVFYEPKQLSKRFSSSVGVGFSYLSYTESVASQEVAKISSIGLTGKAGFTYVLSPRKFDLGANLYATLLPFKLSSTPNTLKASRFYGINLRAGYRLPVDLGAVDWGFAVGYYFWGMLVPGGGYGLETLSGPQIFITLRSQQAHKRSWFSYFKLAPVGESFTLDVSNHEIALGGAYQLTSPQAKRVIMLTLDVSTLAFQSVTFDNEVNVQTISLGVQLAL